MIFSVLIFLEPSKNFKKLLHILYKEKLIADCVQCIDGKNNYNKPCCSKNFEKKCISRGGVVRFNDLHPLPEVMLSCFRKAPDTGKKCSDGRDCFSGVCDLESAIKSNKCTLIKKEFTGKSNQFNNRQKFYTAYYSCTTINPGVCEPAVRDGVNPGGANHYFKIDKDNEKVLIEVLEPGPIY